MVVAVLLAQQASAAPRETVPPPDADFLEFLGSWQSGDDRKWIDPFQDDDPSALEIEDQATEAPPRDTCDRRGTPRIETNPSPRYPTPDAPRPREGVKP